MQIINGIHYYPRESDAREGFLVVPPVGYTTDKKYPVHFIVHGVGERGAGLLENLMNLSMGFDYDGAGPLPRQYALLTGDLRANANKHGHIVVMVNYPVNFDPSDVDFVLNTVEADFSVDKTRINGVGFSWGGREMIRYIVSSAARAQRFAMVILASPVNPGGNLQYIVDAKLQVIGITCQEDPTVSPSNVKAIITGINAKNPSLKAVYIELPGKGHSGLMEFLNGNNPYIPQTMFSYLDAISTLDRKQYPTSITKPVDPIPPQPSVVELIADFNLNDGDVITTPTFTLDASKSKGVKTGYDAYVWGVLPVTGPWMKLSGGAYGGPTKVVTELGNGSYAIELTVKDKAGKEAKKKVNVTAKLGATVPTPTPKVPINFIWPDQLVFNDGSRQTVTPQFTTSDGEIY